jgi:predicted RNA-binding protein with PUA-like domain
MAARQNWLVKTEPSEYSWDDLVREKTGVWDGVRNFEARNNLRAMRRGDRVLVYHSNPEKSVVGIARVTKTAYPDPTADEGDWSVVELAPLQKLEQSVSLERIKADKALAKMVLVRRGRLSVVPVAEPEFRRILKLAGTALAH